MEIINSQFSADLADNKPLKLVLGGGEKVKEGFYNLDLVALENVDVVADLSVPLNLIPDNSVEEIYSAHVLEHVSDLICLMQEIHRITSPSGKIEIVVPHFSNPFYYSDPTHLHPFGLYSMSYFVDVDDQPFQRKLPAFYSRARFFLRDVQLEFFGNGRIDRHVGWRLARIINKKVWLQEFYEKQMNKFISASQIRFILQPKK